MDVDLEHRVARKVLHALLAYSREFGSLDTVIGPDAFGLTAAQFAAIADRLALTGLVTRFEEEGCVVTSDGLAVAMDATKLDELFPLQGDPDAPLPSELELFGRRAFAAAENPPPPMAWDEYVSHLAHVWPRLLNSDSQQDEGVFQRFLERHPCLLPQSFDCFGRGATPERYVYFSQPELPGFRSKRPDFMTITWDSDAVIATLIEIEAPAKPWATQKGFQSAKLTQALDQLREWKVWFREPENIVQFTKVYGLDQRTLETHQFMQRYVLIYGRRSEATANATFAKKRALLGQPDEVLMTYDRLTPNARMDNCPTVRVDRSAPDGAFAAVHIPPTITFGPHNAERLAQLPGLREAISANDLITEERREFLLKRLEYWQSWVRTTPIIDEGRFHSQTFYSE